MILNMESLIHPEHKFSVVNVHLSGGHSGKDHKLRLEQIEILTTQAKEQKSPIILTGDFNHEILEIYQLLKDHDLVLRFIHEKIPLYNTENRV